MAIYDQHSVIRCEDCGNEIPVVTEIHFEDSFEHIMECQEHFDEAVDFIFTEFTKDGIATSVSGLRQTLKYLDNYIALMKVGILNEPVQPEDPDDD